MVGHAAVAQEGIHAGSTTAECLERFGSRSHTSDGENFTPEAFAGGGIGGAKRTGSFVCIVRCSPDCLFEGFERIG
jgi:hypothetical protein